MHVNRIAFFARVDNLDLAKGREVVFESTKFDVPTFHNVFVITKETTEFFKNGDQKLDPQEVIQELRGYFLTPVPLGTSVIARRILSLIADPFLEGLWIRVSGTLSVCGPPFDISLDRVKMEQRRGDQDLPITGLLPYKFWLEATTVWLHPELSPDVADEDDAGD